MPLTVISAPSLTVSGADPERDGDLTDDAAGVLGVQQRLGVPPETVAVPVRLHRRDPVDELTAPRLADPVVPAGGVEFAVRHQLAQHLDGHPRVGVPLCVAVPVGVKHDLGLVVLDAVDGAQHRQPVHPGPGSERQAEAVIARRPPGLRRSVGSSFKSPTGVSE